MKRLVMATLILTGSMARAQMDDLLVVTNEGTSSATSSVEASREIQSSILADVARAQILEILGEKRYQKNKSIVESKIVKQSAKFMPFVSPSAPIQQPDGTWKMSVEIKLSKLNLRKMIVDAGLLNDTENATAILPMISFVDRKGGVMLRWWQGEPKDDAHKFLSQINQLFDNKLQTEFSKQGFHMIRPLGMQVSPLPEPYRADRLSLSDVIFVADYFNVPMVLRGDVRFRDSKDSPGSMLGAIKLEVVQAATGRVVAEVSRHFETDPGAYQTTLQNRIANELPDLSKDLAVQVLEAWQRGTLNANLIRLAIKGTLTPRQLNDLKNGLIQQVREIKSLRERAFEPGQVLFEADYAGEPGPLADRLKTLHFSNLETHVSDASDKGISLEVKIH